MNEKKDQSSLFAYPAGLMPWVIWLLGAIFYSYEFFLQVSTGVMVPDLMQEFAVSAKQMGTIGGLYFWAYALMQIPVGILLDRLGPRRLLATAAWVCSAGALLFAMATHFYFLAAGRFLMGLGSAFAIVGCLHLAATWLPLKRFALISGITLTIGMLGAACAQFPLSLLIGELGWRQTMLWFSGLGVILAIAIYAIVRDRPMPHASEPHRRTDLLAGLKKILRNPQSWVISLYGGLLFAPTTAFGALWGVPFMMKFYTLNRPVAASIVSMLFFGWAAGAPLFGWLSDYIGRRKPPLYIASVGALLSISLVLYVPHLPLVLTGITLFLFGFFTSAFMPGFSIIREINLPEDNATSLGFMNTLNMLGGALMQPFIGFILDRCWDGSLTDGSRNFSVADFHLALLILPASLGLSLLFLPFIQETHCRITSPSQPQHTQATPA